MIFYLTVCLKCPKRSESEISTYTSNIFLTSLNMTLPLNSPKKFKNQKKKHFFFISESILTRMPVFLAVFNYLITKQKVYTVDVKQHTQEILQLLLRNIFLFTNKEHKARICRIFFQWNTMMLKVQVYLVALPFL